MPEQPGAGQAGSNPQSTPAQQAGADGRTPAPGDAQGQHAQQPVIKIGDKEFTVSDVQGILNAKVGLESENAKIKARMKEIEDKDLSEKEKALKDKAELEVSNAQLKKQILDGKVERALATKGIGIKAELLNLGITEESQIEAAVQKLITENPGLIAKANQPGQQPPPGTPSPTGAPPGTDREAEFQKRFSGAQSESEYEKIEQEYRAYKGWSASGGRRVI